MSMPHKCGWLGRPEEVVRTSGAGVTGSSELPRVTGSSQLPRVTGSSELPSVGAGI